MHGPPSGTAPSLATRNPGDRQARRPRAGIGSAASPATRHPPGADAAGGGREP